MGNSTPWARVWKLLPFKVWEALSLQSVGSSHPQSMGSFLPSRVWEASSLEIICWNFQLKGFFEAFSLNRFRKLSTLEQGCGKLSPLNCGKLCPFKVWEASSLQGVGSFLPVQRCVKAFSLKGCGKLLYLGCGKLFIFKGVGSSPPFKGVGSLPPSRVWEVHLPSRVWEALPFKVWEAFYRTS